MTKPSDPLAEAEEPPVVEIKDSRTFPERHSGVVFSILVLLFFPLVIVQSRSKLLWHDELFTYYIAQAPNLSTLLEQTRTLDLNPPLSYLFVRALFLVFPPSATVCRIPSMVGFVLCMACVYWLLQRKLGAPWGIVGVLFLATGDAFPYAFEARPYGLMLGFVSLAFVGWQKATSDAKSQLGLFLLVFGGFGALLSHVFATFAWMILILAEVLRVTRCRRLNWHVLLALLIPLIALVTYVPLISIHAASYYPVAFLPTPLTMVGFYIVMLVQSAFALVCVAFVTQFVAGQPTLKSRGKLPVSAAELFALLGFFAVPAILLLYLMHAHAAFFFRYGIVANFAIATLIPIFLAWLTRGNRTVAWITALALFVWSLLPANILIPAIHPSRLSLSIKKPGACEACGLANRIAPALPFVDASGLTFLEMDSREDTRFLSRVYYLTDPSGSMSYAHANIFEGMQTEKDAFPIRAKVEQYSIFVRQHPTFLVFGTHDYPEDWLLRKLQADGAHLRLLQTVGDPQFKDRELWQVTFATTQAVGNALAR
jgi:hypothetical protein